MSKNRFFRIACLFVAAMMAAFVMITEMVAGNAYKPQERAARAMEGDESVKVEKTLEYIVFTPESNTNGKGIIFYPGGGVDEESYAPLMYDLAAEGYLCVIVRMPFYLAVFDINAADEVMEEVGKDVKWYLAGHSLGGAMAATYADAHDDKTEGVILLAAYSTKDLKDNDLKVLSIYGSADGVLNMENYEKNISNLPADYREVILTGGNHSNFGDYGFQEGDGTGEMSAEMQQEKTFQEIVDFIK